MVYQVYAGYSVAGREIKLPQVYLTSIMRCIILGTGPGAEQLLNVFHVQTPGTPVTLTDCTLLANAIKGWVQTYYLDLFNQKINVEAIHVRSMEAYIAPTFTLNTNIPGNMVGDAMPLDATLPCELTTGLTGRENKGMFYPFPPSELANDVNGRPTVAYATDVADKMARLIDAITTGGFELVIASFVYSTKTPVLTPVVRTRWGSQRRRLTQYG